MKRNRIGHVMAVLGIGVIGAGTFGAGTAWAATTTTPGTTIFVGNLGQSSLSNFQEAHGSCDASNNGWHFIVNQLGATTTLGVEDLPATITITFSDGSQVAAGLQKLVSQTSHYINTTAHQSDGVYPTAASLTFSPGPGGDIKEYGNFNLSHSPCEFPGTTTPTTEAPTTSAAPTTSEAPTTIKAPTTAASVTPSSDATPPSNDTTAVIVASQAPVPPAAGALSEAPVLTPPPVAVLPSTGSTSISLQLLVGFLLTLGGTVMVIRSRRTADA